MSLHESKTGLAGLDIQRKFNDNYGDHFWIKFYRTSENIRGFVNISIHGGLKTKEQVRLSITNSKTEAYFKLPLGITGNYRIGFGMHLFDYTKEEGTKAFDNKNRLEHFTDVEEIYVSEIEGNPAVSVTRQKIKENKETTNSFKTFDPWLEREF